jgi:transcriptional regulator with GAF, ATPase, and Fis domain
MAQLEIKPHAEFDEQSRFEMLLAEISTFFINLPADRIDNEIEIAQRRVCEFLNLDRSALFQVPDGEPDSMLLTHVHQPPGSRPPPERMDVKDFWPWTLQKILGGETLTISTLTDLPAEADRDRESYILYGTKSVVVVPLLVRRGNVVGLLTFTVMREERDWPETVVQQFKLVAQIFANALVRKQMENRLCARPQADGEQTPRTAGGDPAAETSIGEGEHLPAQGNRAAERARGDRRPQQSHDRNSRPNRASGPDGFHRPDRGRAADGATLFLDEIGELPQDVQAKLLRVLEHGRFERLGSTKPLHVNVRIIAASNRDLARDVAEGKFRKDLYYRLNVFPIAIPPLRERPEDIPPLVWAFVRQYERRMGKRIDHIPRKSMEDLQNYPWPGNARELRNVVEHAMIVSSGKTLNVRVPRSASSDISANLSLEDAERRHILDVLQKSGWRLTGRGGAAEILGLKRTTLQSKMKKLGIRRPAK